MTNWYLFRLYRQNKLLFLTVVLFIFFQLYFNIKRVHSFPWFVWDMYSRIETLPDTITQTEIFIDGSRLDITSIPIWEESTVLNTYKMYNKMRVNNYHDPMNEIVKNRTSLLPTEIYSFAARKINNHKTETETYPQWLKIYLEKILHKKINTLELRDVQYKYDKGKFIDLQNSLTVLKIPE